MSVKVPSGGTRGVRFPRVLARLGNAMMIRMFRRGRSSAVGGMPTLMLETRGARSGEPRRVVVAFFAEPPDAWLVVATVGAAARNPAWLHNLAKDPDATIELIGGERIRVRAETVEGADLDAAWRRIAVDAHQYSDYRTKTDREIAVIRLRRRDA